MSEIQYQNRFVDFVKECVNALATMNHSQLSTLTLYSLTTYFLGK
jgi:hypothetical protein